MKYIFFKTKLGIFLVMLIIFSCSTKKNEKTLKVPENIISRDSMIVVLRDFYILENTLNHVQSKGIYIEGYSNVYYNEMLKKHKISRTQFKESVMYYSKNPDALNYIYDEVLTKLIIKQTEINNLEK